MYEEYKVAEEKNKKTGGVSAITGIGSVAEGSAKLAATEVADDGSEVQEGVRVLSETGDGKEDQLVVEVTEPAPPVIEQPEELEETHSEPINVEEDTAKENTDAADATSDTRMEKIEIAIGDHPEASQSADVKDQGKILDGSEAEKQDLDKEVGDEKTEEVEEIKEKDSVNGDQQKEDDEKHEKQEDDEKTKDTEYNKCSVKIEEENEKKVEEKVHEIENRDTSVENEEEKVSNINESEEAVPSEEAIEETPQDDNDQEVKVADHKDIADEDERKEELTSVCVEVKDVAKEDPGSGEDEVGEESSENQSKTVEKQEKTNDDVVSQAETADEKPAIVVDEESKQNGQTQASDQQVVDEMRDELNDDGDKHDADAQQQVEDTPSISKDDVTDTIDIDTNREQDKKVKVISM